MESCLATLSRISIPALSFNPFATVPRKVHGRRELCVMAVQCWPILSQGVGRQPIPEANLTFQVSDDEVHYGQSISLTQLKSHQLKSKYRVNFRNVCISRCLATESLILNHEEKMNEKCANLEESDSLLGLHRSYTPRQ